jgi:hypothetical protein
VAQLLLLPPLLRKNKLPTQQKKRAFWRPAKQAGAGWLLAAGCWHGVASPPRACAWKRLIAGSAAGCCCRRFR